MDCGKSRFGERRSLDVAARGCKDDFASAYRFLPLKVEWIVVNATDSELTVESCLAEIVVTPGPEFPEIKTSEVLDAIKIGVIVILVAFMGAMRKSRQWGRVPRRPSRNPKEERRARAKVILNSGRGPGSKPQGGAA